MGALGEYLRSAREALGIDLRDAAQQTRIRFNYLKALEDEDFSKLPGEVFVRGFLKNYGKFLRLDESEVMRRYAELPHLQVLPGAAADLQTATTVAPERAKPRRNPIEPFLWGAGILCALAILLFTAIPDRRQQETGREIGQASTAPTASVPSKPAKLYLEVVALENTWLTVRTDTSPVKRVELNKGESLTWSAEERFLVSYGNAGSVKLALNGQELTVDENAPVSDLAITAAGIENRPVITPEAARQVKPKKKTGVEKPSGEPRRPAPQKQPSFPQQLFPWEPRPQQPAPLIPVP